MLEVYIEIGILIDVFYFGNSIRKLNNEKCPTSKAISEQLESLRPCRNAFAIIMAQTTEHCDISKPLACMYVHIHT